MRIRIHSPVLMNCKYYRQCARSEWHIPGMTLKNSNYAKNWPTGLPKWTTFVLCRIWQYSASDWYKGSGLDPYGILNTSEREAYRKTHIINALNQSELSRTTKVECSLPTKSRCSHFYNQNKLELTRSPQSRPGVRRWEQSCSSHSPQKSCQSSSASPPQTVKKSYFLLLIPIF